MKIFQLPKNLKQILLLLLLREEMLNAKSLQLKVKWKLQGWFMMEHKYWILELLFKLDIFKRWKKLGEIKIPIWFIIHAEF